MDDDEARQMRRDFSDAVNMSPRDLETWLATEESRAVGDSGGGGESTGHEMGRHIVPALKRAPPATWSAQPTPRS